MVEWGQISCFWHSKLNEVSGPVTTQGHVEVKTDDVTIGESKNHFLWNFLWILYFWCYSIIPRVKNLKIPTLMMPTMMVSTVTRVNSNKQKQQTNGKTTGDSDYQNNVSKSFSRNFENVRKWFCPDLKMIENGEKKMQKWQKIFRRSRFRVNSCVTVQAVSSDIFRFLKLWIFLPFVDHFSVFV